MNFCEQCGSRLLTNYQQSRQSCRKCGSEIDVTKDCRQSDQSILDKNAHNNVIIIDPDEANINVLPSIKIDCPKCVHDRAYSQIIEIGQEDGIIDIQLNRCTKCGHSWREKT
jgi:DNA-directed RNA polymerase subunit M/transcription elongation factor TFIIS